MRFFKKSKELDGLTDLKDADDVQDTPVRVSLGQKSSKTQNAQGANARAQHDVVDVDAVEVPVDAKVKKQSLFAGLKMGKKSSKAEQAAPSAQEGESAPTDAAQASENVTSEKPSKSKWFSAGAFSKKAKNESDAGTAPGGSSKETPKKAKKPKKSKTKAGASVYLTTEIENGRTIFWELGATTLRQLEEAPAGARVFSFSKDDVRYRADKAMNDRKAQGVALSDIGENVGIVNLSKAFGAIYACRLSKLQNEPYVIAPGVQVFEPEMLSRETDTDQILGAMLSDDTTGQSMAILVHVNSVGDAESAQVSLNPENMNFVLSQFMASRKINRARVQTLIFNNQEILELSKDAKAYPSSLMLYGLPVSTLRKSALGSTSLLALTCMAWAGLQYYSLDIASQDKAALTGEIRNLSSKRLDVLANSLGSITAEMRTDVAPFVSQAEALWVPGSNISATARLETWEYVVVMPLANKDNVASNPAGEVRSASELMRLMNLNVPENCTKSNLTSANTQNEFKITVTCSIERGRFARIVQ